MTASDSIRYFEDYALGETVEVGGRTVTKDEIIAFAERYDPQPYHVDEAAAAASIYGGLVASGFHTLALCCRMLVDEHFRNVRLLGGSGIDELRWHAPVFPNDTLSVRAEVIEARPSEEAPDRGVLRELIEVLNQDDEVVLSLVPTLLVQRQGASAVDG